MRQSAALVLWGRSSIGPMPISTQRSAARHLALLGVTRLCPTAGDITTIFASGPGGRPLIGGGLDSRLAVSLSHTDTYAAAMVWLRRPHD